MANEDKSGLHTPQGSSDNPYKNPRILSANEINTADGTDEVKINDLEKSSYTKKALDSQTNPEGFRDRLQERIDKARTPQRQEALQGKKDRWDLKDKLKTKKKEQLNFDKMNKLRKRKGLAPIAPGSVDRSKLSAKQNGRDNYVELLAKDLQDPESKGKLKASSYLEDSAVPPWMKGEGGLEGLLGVSGDIQL